MPSGRSFYCYFTDKQGPHSRQHAQTSLWILILLFLGYVWPWESPFDALELSFSIGSDNANHRHIDTVKEIIHPYNISYHSAWHNVALAVLSHIQLFATPWTTVYQAPLSMRFSRQDTGVGCHFLLQRIFPTQAKSLPLSHQGSPRLAHSRPQIKSLPFLHWESLLPWLFHFQFLLWENPGRLKDWIFF